MRKRRDLNPRCTCAHNTLAVCPIRPLWHASQGHPQGGHRVVTLPGVGTALQSRAVTHVDQRGRATQDRQLSIDRAFASGISAAVQPFPEYPSPSQP